MPSSPDQGDRGNLAIGRRPHDHPAAGGEPTARAPIMWLRGCRSRRNPGSAKQLAESRAWAIGDATRHVGEPGPGGRSRPAWRWRPSDTWQPRPRSAAAGTTPGNGARRRRAARHRRPTRGGRREARRAAGAGARPDHDDGDRLAVARAHRCPVYRGSPWQGIARAATRPGGRATSPGCCLEPAIMTSAHTLHSGGSSGVRRG